MTDDQGNPDQVAGDAVPVRPGPGPGRRRDSLSGLSDVLRRRTATEALYARPGSVVELTQDRAETGTPAQVGAEVPEDDRDSPRNAGVRASLAAIMRTGTGVLTDVPLAELRPNTFQPRMHFARRPLEELARSLAEEGQIEPVIARRVFSDGLETLELVAGARRLEAARMCDATIRPFPTLRTEIRDLTDEEAERLSLIENLQRENLTPLEEGYRYTHLQRRDPTRWSVRAIADFVHKKKSTIQNRLHLVRDLAVAEAVLGERIPPTAGFHIMRLPAEMRATYLAEAVRHGLTVEQVRADVDRRITILRGTASRAGTGANLEALVGADPVSTSPTALPAADGDASPTSRTMHVRRLRAQRVQVGLRIDELETELRRHVGAFRELSAEIAKVDGLHD